MEEYLPNQPQATPQKKSNNKTLIIVAVAVIILILIALGYLWFTTSSPQNSTQTRPNVPSQNQKKTQAGGLISSLSAQNNSGETGLATLIETNGKTTVVLTISPTQTTPQPAHIHTGTCANLDKIVYPLSPVVNGKSQTTLNVSLAQIEKQFPLVVNVHKSDAEANSYVSCGNIVTDTSFQAPTQQQPAATQSSN